MIQRNFRLWATQCHGQAAVLFALMAFPIFIVSGFSLDAMRQVSLKKSLQEVVDASALAGARTFSYSFLTADAGRSATTAYNSNIASLPGDVNCTLNAHEFDTASFSVKVSAKCEVPTIFGIGVSGRSKVAVEAEATGAAIHKTADVALMFDLSSSMSSAELLALKAAGKRAAELIIGVQPGARGRVAVVPFAGGVNAGDFGNAAIGRTSDNDDEGDDVGRVCVTERTGAEAFTDADPSTNPVGGVLTWADTVASSGFDRQSSVNCPDSPVHPLEDDLNVVKGVIDGMSRSAGIGGGTTAGHLGIAWSWYTLSPNWDSVWENMTYGGHGGHGAQPYGDPNLLKVAILMTDGTFTQAFAEGVADPDTGIQEANIAMAAEALCAGMRAEGIIVYAVAFNATTEAETLLQNCSDNDPDFYFETNNMDQLDDIYEQIAGKYLTVGIVG
ncbi:MAG: pilus assembly protein TadG-related protein [Pseudomonadota bacterium]